MPTLREPPVSVAFTVFRGSQDGKVRQSKTHRDLSKDDVLVKITHSGLCYTDILYRTADMVLGHEGVGIVESLGPDCKDLKIGDRVGWGYVQDTCGFCDMCLQGEDMRCPIATLYGVGNLDIGSLSSHAVVREAFLLRVPAQIELVDAGPLFCGGAAVFEPLNRHNVTSADRVGIFGVGGLGHLAIQFAAKMGCQVVVFSSTEGKKDEATKLGATEFYVTEDVDSLSHVRPINCLLVTSRVQPDWKIFLDIMAPKGKIFPLTVEMGNFENFPAFPVNIKGLTVQGSACGPRILYRRMLDFAARNGVRPIVQTFPMTEEGIEEAMKALVEGKIRYRAVLVAQN
ncbi:chaperonin 10-like protein [Schizophyllum fasciatum]